MQKKRLLPLVKSSGSGKSRAYRILGLILFAYSFVLSPATINAQMMADTITTIAGNGTYGYSGDGGPAIEAVFFEPVSVAFDKYGNLFIDDYRNFVIRKVNLNGTISTVAGKDTAGYAGDGGLATDAEIGGITAIAVDNAGNLYLADYDNQAVRMVNAATGIITTFAGIGAVGYSGDGGSATQAELSYPNGLAVDGGGNVYISDNGNNVVRVVNPRGIISTYVGNNNSGVGGTAGYSGDGGPATAANLYSPAGLFVDTKGGLYIADEGNNVIRYVPILPGPVVTPGNITTVAGNAWLGPGYSGDGGSAIAGQLSDPTSVAVDGGGNLYIAEYGNNLIRKVSAYYGILSTVAGTDTAIGYVGDGGPATAAEFYGPYGIAFDKYDNLYIADKFHSAIRKIGYLGSLGVASLATPNSDITLLPNPNNGIFTLKGTLGNLTDQNVSLQITDMLGRVVYTTDVIAQKGIINTQVDPGVVANGMYLLRLQSEGENNIYPFVVEK